MSAHQPSHSPKRWFLYSAVALLFLFAIWYFGFRPKPKGERPEQPAWAGTTYPPALPVRTVLAQEGDLALRLKAIGTVVPLATVTVKTRVEGTLLRFAFKEGDTVEAGQLLAEIDPSPFLIDLAQAEGQLKQNTARLRSAKSDLERTRDLHAKSLVTDQALETQAALVAEREGAVTVDKARVDDARLLLDYTRIQAPITGRAGLRRIDPGNLVRPNDTEGLVMLTQTRPINVRFTLPEADLPKVLVPLRRGETLVAEAWDRTDRTRLATGRLLTVDNQIDVATGTIKLKAEFPNEDEALFPNQFVNVKIQVGIQHNGVLIPSVAVQYGSRGTYVYLVDAKNRARVRDLVLGPTDGEKVLVLQGLKPGEIIVLEGLDRLREGSHVVLANEPLPTPKPVSKP